MNKTPKILLTIGVLIALSISLSSLYKQYSPSQLGGTDFNVITSFGTFSKVAATTTQTLALASNPARVYALFTNDSDTAVYLNLSNASTTVVNYAVRLNANGGTYEMNDTNLYLGNVYASTTVGGKNILVLEK